MNNDIIRFENVSKKLIAPGGSGQDETTILPDMSFTIDKGEFTSITGPSGSGKTTMLYLMGGLDKPSGGDIFLDGEKISSMNEDELAVIRNEKLGFVYQFHFLLPEFTALENVMMPMIARGKYSSSRARERAKMLLNEMEMGDKLSNKPNQLSGGQQQRVAIARALANDPVVLLTDEPTGNLDSKNSLLIFELFKKLNETYNQTIVVVTHDEHFAAQTRRILHILDGRLDKDEKK